MNDLSCGILQQLFEVFAKTFIFAGYLFLYARARVFDVPGTAWAWVLCFLGVDFLYYWFHRLSHERNGLWAMHLVHHSSEEYNLAVALRQSSLHGLFTWVFYLPLALIGVPPVTFVVCYGLNLLYQFWIHTQAVGRLGRLTEWVMNTPSHHRVHHGRNPRYLDRNHGGVLIVWDRLFGTFAAESERDPVVYGITHDLTTYNPLRIAVHEFVAIARDLGRARSLKAALGYLFAPPGWSPDGSTLTADQLRRGLGLQPRS